MSTFEPLVSLSLFGVVSTFLLIMARTPPVLATDFPAQFEISALDGVNGFTLNGVVTTGERVAGAGDVKGDGFPDFYVSDSSTSPNGLNCGQVFVVFSTGHNFPAIFELSSLDGTNGFTLNGVAREDRLKRSRKRARKRRKMTRRMDTGASLDVGFQRLEVRQGVSPGHTLEPSK